MINSGQVGKAVRNLLLLPKLKEVINLSSDNDSANWMGEIVAGEREIEDPRQGSMTVGQQEAFLFFPDHLTRRLEC